MQSSHLFYWTKRTYLKYCLLAEIEWKATYQEKEMLSFVKNNYKANFMGSDIDKETYWMVVWVVIILSKAWYQ